MGVVQMSKFKQKVEFTEGVNIASTAGGSIAMGTLGAVSAFAATGQSASVGANGSSLNFDGGGNFAINCALGSISEWNANGASLSFSGSGNATLAARTADSPGTARLFAADGIVSANDGACRMVARSGDALDLSSGGALTATATLMRLPGVSQGAVTLAPDGVASLAALAPAFAFGAGMMSVYSSGGSDAVAVFTIARCAGAAATPLTIASMAQASTGGERLEVRWGADVAPSLAWNPELPQPISDAVLAVTLTFSGDATPP